MATPVVFSWSMGKDSAFGLWKLHRDPSYKVESLLTTITEGYDRVSMSGVREALLDRQVARRAGTHSRSLWSNMDSGFSPSTSAGRIRPSDRSSGVTSPERSTTSISNGL